MKVLCFGDSNTYGFDPRSYFGGRYDADSRWVDIVAAKTGWDFINAGQNGLSIPNHEYDTELCSRIISRKEADLLILMLGSNDLLQGHSAGATARRMERFVSDLKTPMENILLISPVPFCHGQWIEDERVIEHSRQLGSFYKSLAEKLGLLFADAALWDVGLCYDGVHFTEKGHRNFAEELHKILINIKEK